MFFPSYVFNRSGPGTGFEHLDGQGDKLLLKVFAEEIWKYIFNPKIFLLIICPFLCGH
jgi:hypothetical protein